MKRLLFALLLAPAAQAADLGILKQACAACHAPEAKQAGPAFKAVAAKYKTVVGAEQSLALKIRRGSVGTWGTTAMPPAFHISELDARKLANWVLGM